VLAGNDNHPFETPDAGHSGVVIDIQRDVARRPERDKFVRDPCNVAANAIARQGALEGDRRRLVSFI
jgi:hypothetical protein